MKIDCHIHSFRSGDSVNRPKTIIHMAHKKDLAIAITDHNTNRAWKEMNSLGRTGKVKVIQGEEIMTFDEKKIGGELIGLFMNEYVKPGNYLEVIDSLREQDAFITVPHPFDFLRSNFSYLKTEFKKIDAVEVFNSRCYSDSFNSKAKAFALAHNLPVTAGSDAHFPEEIGNAFIELPKAFSLEDARKMMKKNLVKVSGKRSSLMVHVKTFFAKKGFFKPKNY
ncbi:PHP domain-containing protein [Candidatus Micrarchaeota archaeon]|nr:PHP domain-containing protein [Candidatus Micrarchaeota archaeon]